jgi:hypothetical protein
VSHSSRKDRISRRLKVLYQYTYENNTYQSDRYCFLSTDPFFYVGLNRIFEAQRTSREIPCYVNPANPKQAILKRDFQPYLLLTLISPVSIGVGFWCFVIWLKIRFGAKTPGQEENTSLKAKDDIRTFTPQSPVQQIKVLLIITIFLNGSLWFWLFCVAKSGIFALPNECMLILAVVSLLLIFKLIHTLFGIGNPTPSITIEPAELKYGASAMLSWNWQGRAGRVRKLKITLTGEQILYYKEGKKLRTEENKFFEMPLVETEFPREIVSGQAAFVMPDGDVPETGDIVWSIKIYGQVKFWSDIGEEIEIMSQRKPTWAS